MRSTDIIHQNSSTLHVVGIPETQQSTNSNHTFKVNSRIFILHDELAQMGFTGKQFASIDQYHPERSHNTLLRHIDKTRKLTALGFTTANLASMLTRSGTNLAPTLTSLTSEDAINKFQKAKDLGFAPGTIAAGIHGNHTLYLQKLELLTTEQVPSIIANMRPMRISNILKYLITEKIEKGISLDQILEQIQENPVNSPETLHSPTIHLNLTSQIPNIHPKLAQIGLDSKHFNSIDQNHPQRAHDTALEHIDKIEKLTSIGFAGASLSSMLTRSGIHFASALTSLTSDAAINKFERALDLGSKPKTISSGISGNPTLYLAKLDLLATEHLVAQIREMRPMGTNSILKQLLIEKETSDNQHPLNSPSDTSESTAITGNKHPREQSDNHEPGKTLTLSHIPHTDQENLHAAPHQRELVSTTFREHLSPVTNPLPRTQSNNSTNSTDREAASLLLSMSTSVTDFGL